MSIDATAGDAASQDRALTGQVARLERQRRAQ